MSPTGRSKHDLPVDGMAGGEGLSRFRRLFAERYDALRSQIARRLGMSDEIAGDALHDAYIRLVDREDLDRIQHQQSYLVNTAVNVAIDWIRRDRRLVSEEEVSDLFELSDNSPGPERVAADRHDTARLLAVMAQLPPRQSALLYAARVEGVSTEDLARRWGLSSSMVRREIQQAQAFCLAAMGRLDASGKKA